MSVAENLKTVTQKITNALERSGRAPDSVTLVVVTKTVDAPRIQEALTAGVSHLGENKVQEALPKIEAIRDHSNVTWHMIGHLQTNKVKRAVEYFHMIHAADSVRLVEEIHARAVQQGKIMEVLLEVNVSGEASKFGLRPEDLLSVARAAARFEGIALKGLMTMAPFLPNAEETRPYFRKLRECLLALQDSGLTQMTQLSMGMTNDFEVAIEEGATMVRIGTAIFGER